MKIFILILLFLLFALSSIGVCAQTVSPETKSNDSDCNQESFEKVEESYNLRRYRSESNAELQLKDFVSKCADYSWRYQAEEYLRNIQEESAEYNFIIARYYWNKFQDGKTKSLSGVISRLKIITADYPNYSQIILVKQLLDEANTANR